MKSEAAYYFTQMVTIGFSVVVGGVCVENKLPLGMQIDILEGSTHLLVVNSFTGVLASFNPLSLALNRLQPPPQIFAHFLSIYILRGNNSIVAYNQFMG